MAQRDDESIADTTIDLAVVRGRLRAARGTVAGIAVLAAVLVGAVVAWRHDPFVVETRFLVDPIRLGAEAGAEKGRAARDDRLVAAQIGLLETSDVLRRAVAGADAAVVGRGEGDASGLDRDDRRLAALRENLTVERVDRSRLVALRLVTTDAAEGTRLLTTLWDEYLGTLREARNRAEAEADRRRGGDVVLARRRLADAETPPAAGSEPVEPIAASADPELDAARAERADAVVRLERLEKFAASGDGGAERAVDAGLTGSLRQLREKRGLLRSHMAELSVVYLANHPLVKEATDRFADLRREIRAELPRAVVAQKAALAALDRRILELAAATTASVPEPATPAAEPDLAALRAALTDAVARRDAAFGEALGLAAVSVRQVNPPEVIEAPSLVRPLLAALCAALAGGGLAGGYLTLRAPGGSARPLASVPDRHAAFEPTFATAPVSMPIPVTMTAPEVRAEPVEPTRPRDPDAPRRAAVYGAAARASVPALWREIEAEIPEGRRIVVTSVADAAHAHGAARALWHHAAGSQASVCCVDLAGTLAENEAGFGLGFADLLAGAAAFSEVIRRDRDCGGWIVPAGRDPVATDAYGDAGLAGILDALALTWGDLVIDVGRLEPGEGLAALLVGADAIILAEDDAEDPRALRALDALVSAGKAVWLMEVPLEPAAAVVDGSDAWDVAA